MIVNPNKTKALVVSRSRTVSHRHGDLPHTVFDTGTLDGIKGAVYIWFFPELSFLQFSVAQVLVWLRKQFINNFVFLKMDMCCWF